MGLPGMIVQKTKTQPKQSAAEGGRLLVLLWGLKYNHFLGAQNEIHILNISNGTYFPSSNYVFKYRFLRNFVIFRISCQIAIRRPLCQLQQIRGLSLSLDEQRALYLRSYLTIRVGPPRSLDVIRRE